MPSPNEPVQPTPFDAPRPVAPTPTGENNVKPPGGHSPWLLASLAGIVLLAVGVFTWLPGQVEQPGAAQPPVTAAQPPTTAAKPPATAAEPARQPEGATPAPPRNTAQDTDTAAEEAAPWEESLRAKMRRQAQSVLEPLLDRQFELEQMEVSRWAPDEFNAALALASTGDDLYRKREFDAATDRYREALDAMDALLASVPQRTQALLEDTDLALEALDTEAAFAALETLDHIAPGNTEAAALRERAALQPALLEAFGAAASAETAGQLEAALAALDRAVETDPAHRRAQSESARVSEALKSQQYQDAMSRGYVALADNQLAEARAAFRAATLLRPGAQEAKDALAQAGTANTEARLAGLKRDGLRLERAEQWQQAVAKYEQALALDGTVLFAREGLQRARPRAQLDKQLRELIEQPARLSSNNVAQQTANLLQQARSIEPRGQVLAGQISALETALQLANTPVPVTLHSDTLTEVTVYKVARLGRFQQHQLQLRPGTYTAVGHRVGYRDVLERFTIEPGATSLTVTIACTEAI